MIDYPVIVADRKRWRLKNIDFDTASAQVGVAPPRNSQRLAVKSQKYSKSFTIFAQNGTSAGVSIGRLKESWERISNDFR